jgi:hypothetical protein
MFEHFFMFEHFYFKQILNMDIFIFEHFLCLNIFLFELFYAWTFFSSLNFFRKLLRFEFCSDLNNFWIEQFSNLNNFRIWTIIEFE